MGRRNFCMCVGVLLVCLFVVVGACWSCSMLAACQGDAQGKPGGGGGAVVGRWIVCAYVAYCGGSIRQHATPVTCLQAKLPPPCMACVVSIVGFRGNWGHDLFLPVCPNVSCVVCVVLWPCIVHVDVLRKLVVLKPRTCSVVCCKCCKQVRSGLLYLYIVMAQQLAHLQAVATPLQGTKASQTNSCQ